MRSAFLGRLFLVGVLVAVRSVPADGVCVAPDWDQAMVRGTTPHGKILYEVGEEMEFSLRLEGVRGTVPTNTYFLDWRRRGDDGVTQSGRAPLPLADPFVYRTKSDRPGFVFLEANVVTADGKLVPKNHRWEKRVFFGGGAGVEPEKLVAGDEPADYETFWQSVLKELDAVPVKAQLQSVPSKDPKVEISSFRIDCAGGYPVTGYVSVPTAVRQGNTFRLCANFMGAATTCMPVQQTGPSDAIWAIVNANGYELGREPDYYKGFFQSISEPGYSYGFGPAGNKSRHASYWKGVAMRAIRLLQWMKTLPGWNGVELELRGGSQGDWQSYMAAAWIDGVTAIHANGSWGCDWTGQEQFGRMKSCYRPKCWFSDMAYFDPVFAARRISCPVEIAFAGLGDYVSPPSSISVLYNNLKGPKKLTYVQGSSHGWRPKGEQTQTVDGGYDAAVSRPTAGDPLGYIHTQLSKGVRSVRLNGGVHRVVPSDGAIQHLILRGLSDAVIDFGGATLIGEVNTAMFALEGCTNVTIRNVTIDYAPLPFTQAEILSVDEECNWVVRIIDGYPRPSDAAIARHDRFWPIQVYDGRSLELKNPMRFRDGIAISREDERTYRVRGGQDRRGNAGDIAVWSIPETDRKVDDNTVSSVHCRNCRFEDVTVYSTPKGCAFYEYGCCSNAYVRCVLDRCPESADYAKRGLRRLRSGNHDALNSRCSVRGPLVDRCRFRYHCDDCVNISGYYAFVVSQQGRWLRVAPFSGVNRIDAGDSCQLMTFDGECLSDAKAVSVRPAGATTADERKTFEGYHLWPMIASWATKAYEVELDRETTLPPGSVIISNNRMGNGFSIQNSEFGPNRARGLIIRASDGGIVSNRITGVEGWAVQAAPGYEWMEGGCSRRILMQGNVMTGNGGGISVSGNNGARKLLPPAAHSRIAIVSNVVEKSFSGLEIIGCSGLVLKGNRVEPSGKCKPIRLVNVRDVKSDVPFE